MAHCSNLSARVAVESFPRRLVGNVPLEKINYGVGERAVVWLGGRLRRASSLGEFLGDRLHSWRAPSMLPANSAASGGPSQGGGVERRAQAIEVVNHVCCQHFEGVALAVVEDAVYP